MLHRDAHAPTIGHSTHPADRFTDLLRAHRITTLADVRSVPRSRHNPQFDREALAASLEAVAIGYVHLPALGGMRRPRADSVKPRAAERRIPRLRRLRTVDDRPVYP